MREETSIRKAEFAPNVCTYWLLQGALIFTITVIGIPLLLLWFPLGFLFTKRYLASMECLLTEKALKVNKGIFVRTEKTIPLGKITDMGIVQGPIMRHFGIHKITVETAGQSGEGALVSLTGIVDVKAFREAVLNQAEAMSASSSPLPSASASQESQGTNALLSDIRDSLLRLEAKLDKRSDDQ